MKKQSKERKNIFESFEEKLSYLQAKYEHYSEKFSTFYHDFTDRDKLFLYAASLSFYTIFSIIPLFLLLFSIIAGFPSFIEHVESFKQSILSHMLPDNTQDFSIMLDDFLSNGREMGFLGFLVALVTSFIFFRNFDDVSARIFTAKKRSYFDSFIIYWLLVTLIPLFAATSIYFSAIIANKYENELSWFFALLPLLTTWLSFGILFRVAANKSLRFSVLTFSGFVGAILWNIFKIAFFYYMSYNKFYSNIYGSMSMIMFLFMWIYVSWLVVLISMRLCKILDSKFPYIKQHTTQDSKNNDNIENKNIQL